MHVSGLWIYPVKALRGVERSQSKMTRFGLEHDRRYMLARPDGTFITQRTHPQLATFDVVAGEAGFDVVSSSGERVSIPWNGVDGEPVEATIWKDTVPARFGHDRADDFFSRPVGEALRLVWMPDSTHRQTDLEWSEEGDQVSFADGYPILILSEASVASINDRLEQPLPADRYRANVILAGPAAWEEDSWSHVHLGDVPIRVVKPCGRCIVTTTDQQTGERGKEPMQTLATWRKQDGKVRVGMNCIPASEGGIIRVGDPITVI